MGIDREQRVCPDCGEPAGQQPFCAHCGINLSRHERLPTRHEYETANGGSATGSERMDQPAEPSKPAQPDGSAEQLAPGELPRYPLSDEPLLSFTATDPAPSTDRLRPWRERPMASWGYRVGATVTDFMLAVAAGYAAWAVADASGAAAGDAESAAGLAGLGFFLINVVVIAAITDGKTLGKQLAAIRVVRESSKRYGIGVALVRDVLLRLLYVIPLVWLIDSLMPLGDERQSLRDRIVSTRVMREPAYQARRWLLTSAALVLVGGWIAALSASGAFDEQTAYSASDRETFIDGCVNEGDGITESDCGCAFDHIAAQLVYAEYSEADRQREEDWSPHVTDVIRHAFEGCPGFES